MSDGTGMDTAPVGPNQTDRARANATEQQGNGKLLGPRSGRDNTTDAGYLKRSVPPPPMPETRWQPPKQPCGNAKDPRL